MKKVKLFDSTLRDGSHAVKQRIYAENIEKYCRYIDKVGMHTVIVGHGNGLGASSIQMGECAIDEMEMLKVARKNLKQTPLGTFVTVGFGTIEKEVKQAILAGAEIFCIATHCTEADTMKKHIEYLSSHSKECYGVLMNIHLSEPKQLLEEGRKIEDYGADGVILMDSAGASTPEFTKKVISMLSNHLSIEIGFHPHNNLGIAVSNAYVAIQEGASIIDGTIGGFGAGAGNCQLEALQALLEKEKIETKARLYPMLDAAKYVVTDDFSYSKMIDGTSIVSGYAGVVSTFKERVKTMAKEYNVDPREIFMELGRRKAIAGQDDLILEVAQQLSMGKEEKAL